MDRYIKNILFQVVVVTASVFGVTACTPKVIVDQGASTIQVEHDAAGGTSVRVTPRDESSSTRPTPTQLGASKAATEKELGDLINRRDKSRTELEESHRAADAVTAAIKRIVAAKATAEQELSSVSAKVTKAKNALASADTDTAASERRLPELKKRQTKAVAAVAVAQTALDSAKVETAKVAANLDDLRFQVEAKQCELAAIAAQVADSGNRAATQPARAAEISMPTVNTAGRAQGTLPSEPKGTSSPTGPRQAKGYGDSRQAPLVWPPGIEQAWRMAALSAATVLGLAAIAGVFIVWLAPRGSYTCLLHSLKTGQDVSQSICGAREGMVMTADGAATMTPVECLNPRDTYLGVNSFGRPVLRAGDGVSVNGEALPSGSGIKLQPGTHISVGPDAVFEFRSCLRSDAQEESETALAL